MCLCILDGKPSMSSLNKLREFVSYKYSSNRNLCCFFYFKPSIAGWSVFRHAAYVYVIQTHRFRQGAVQTYTGQLWLCRELAN